MFVVSEMFAPTAPSGQDYACAHVLSSQHGHLIHFPRLSSHHRDTGDL